jgi:hypothetical protein
MPLESPRALDPREDVPARCAVRAATSLIRAGGAHLRDRLAALASPSATAARLGLTSFGLRCLPGPGAIDRPAPFIPARLCVRIRRSRISVLAAGRRRAPPWRLLRERTGSGIGRRTRRPLARGRSRLPDAPASSAVSVAPRRAFAFQPRGHLRARATTRRECSATLSSGHDSLRAGPRTDLKLASPPSRGHHSAARGCTLSKRSFARARQAGRGRERET